MPYVVIANIVPSKITKETLPDRTTKQAAWGPAFTAAGSTQNARQNCTARRDTQERIALRGRPASAAPWQSSSVQAAYYTQCGRCSRPPKTLKKPSDPERAPALLLHTMRAFFTVARNTRRGNESEHIAPISGPLCQQQCQRWRGVAATPNTPASASTISSHPTVLHNHLLDNTPDAINRSPIATSITTVQVSALFSVA